MENKKLDFSFSRFALMLWCLSTLAPVVANTQSPEGRVAIQQQERKSMDGSHDFDWYLGHWDVRNRFLTARLAGSTDWVEFDATVEAFSTLLGLGNIDRFRSTFAGEPFEGMTVRYFNPSDGNWYMYWIDSRAIQYGNPDFDDPMVGGFDGPKGTFYGTSAHEGRQVDVRFIWTVMGANRARWEQAFSSDGGENWEVNWVMDFTRRAVDGETTN